MPSNLHFRSHFQQKQKQRQTLSLSGLLGCKVVWPMTQKCREREGQLVGVSVIEEERRRERRKHRKRVARIVVEHWKWVSRAALRAARHRRQCLLFAALKSFRRNVSDRRLQLRTALVLHHKRMFSCLEACLFEWREHSQTRRARSAAVGNFVLQTSLRLVGDTFVAWKRFWEYKKQRQWWLKRADCYREFSLASVCVHGWCERKNELCSKREANLVALHYWSRVTCRTALKGMKEYRHKKELVRVLEEKAGELWMRTRVHVCIQGWIDCSSAALEGRKHGVEKLEHVQGILWEGKVRNFVCEWHLWVVESKWERSWLEEAGVHYERCLQEKALGRYRVFQVSIPQE